MRATRRVSEPCYKEFRIGNDFRHVSETEGGRVRSALCEMPDVLERDSDDPLRAFDTGWQDQVCRNDAGSERVAVRFGHAAKVRNESGGPTTPRTRGGAEGASPTG